MQLNSTTSMARSIVTREASNPPRNLLGLELRHVEASKLFKLSTILDMDKAWGSLLEELTRRDPSQSNLSLSLNTINLIKGQTNCGKSPSLALLNHWAITGRRRPTIGVLLNYLNHCQLKWAADYVRQSILGVEPLEYSACTKLTPNLRSQSGTYEIDDEFKFDNLPEITNHLDQEQMKYPFKLLYNQTDGFSNALYDPINQDGFKIGEGRFSSVYRTVISAEDVCLSKPDDVVAVKLLKSACNRNYLTNEINLMAKIRHENILELISVGWDWSGFEKSHGYICLVYPYMQNGSLLDCLDSGLATRNMEPVNWQDRINMARKIASGISFFHNFPDGPIIHRDIKTANIFVGVDLEPKLGDFTLVRQIDRITSGQFSQNIIGTSVYMPPEAFRGDISTKFDIFSYGVVVLELLTGLKPFNSEHNEDLLTHISERLSDINDEYVVGEARNRATDEFLRDILDRKAGDWDLESAKILFSISSQATEARKQSRPEISKIVSLLEAAHL